MTRVAFLATTILLAACASEAVEPRRADDTTMGRAARKQFKAPPPPLDDDVLRGALPADPLLPLRPDHPVERRLANGVRILVLPRHDFPSVALAIVVDRGQCDGGAAADIHACAFGSSADQSRWENLDYLHYVGVQLRRSARPDAIVVRATVLPPLLASVLSRLVPMVLTPGLSGEDLADARRALKDGLSSDESWRERMAERALRESLFGRGGYGTVLVNAAEVDRVSDAQVRELADAARAPGHVTVIAVGDTTPEDVVRLVARYSAGLPRGTVSTSSCAALPVPTRSNEVIVVDDPDAHQSQIAIGAVGVPVAHADGPALRVLAASMGASLSSRLNLKVRQEHGLSYGVRMHAREWRAHGLLDISCSVETARTAEAVKGIAGELDRVALEPLDEGELTRAKLLALPDMGPHESAAAALIDVGAYRLRAEAVDIRSRTMLRVTASDVTRVAGKYLAPPKRAIAIVGDAARIAPALEALGVGKVVIRRR